MSERTFSIRRPGEAFAAPLNGRVEAYAREVGFLLTNKGDRTILGTATVVRIACENQFGWPALSIPHTSDDAARFRDDPASFVQDLIRFADKRGARTEARRAQEHRWELV